MNHVSKVYADNNCGAREWTVQGMAPLGSNQSKKLGGKPARVWIRLKTNHTISAHSDRIGSYERAIEKGWSRAYTIRSRGDGKEKKRKKTSF